MAEETETFRESEKKKASGKKETETLVQIDKLSSLWERKPREREREREGGSGLLLKVGFGGRETEEREEVEVIKDDLIWKKLV
jgi:hypothetical protein